jgi:hypothetical protein
MKDRLRGRERERPRAGSKAVCSDFTALMREPRVVRCRQLHSTAEKRADARFVIENLDSRRTRLCVVSRTVRGNEGSGTFSSNPRVGPGTAHRYSLCESETQSHDSLILREAVDVGTEMCWRIRHARPHRKNAAPRPCSVGQTRGDLCPPRRHTLARFLRTARCDDACRAAPQISFVDPPPLYVRQRWWSAPLSHRSSQPASRTGQRGMAPNLHCAVYAAAQRHSSGCQFTPTALLRSLPEHIQ